MNIWSPSKWWRDRQERNLRYRLEREGRRQRTLDALPRTRIGRTDTGGFVYYDFGSSNDCDAGGDSGGDGGCGGGD